MHHRYLWHLLTSLSPDEVPRFQRWLRYDLGDRQQPCQQLYAALMPYLPPKPEENPPVPAEPDIWATLFPGQPYQDRRFRHLAEELCRACERFIAHQQAEAPDRYPRLLLAGLAGRVEPKWFHRLWQRHFEPQGQALMAENEGLQAAFEAALLRQDYLVGQNVSPRSPEFKDALQTTQQALDRWYLYQKAKLTLSEAQIGLSDPAAYARQLDTLLDQLPLSHMPIWMGHFRRIAKFLQGERAVMADVTDLLQESRRQMPPDLQKALFLFGYNFLARRYNQTAKKEHGEALLALYSLGIEHGYLLEAGYLSLDALKNYVVLSLQLRPVPETREKLQTFLPLVVAHRQAEAQAFNQALCDFAAEDYPLAIRGFQTFSFKQTEYQLMAALKTLHAYYHLSAAPALLSPAEYASLRNQLQKQERQLRLLNTPEIPEHVKARYQNHLRLFRKLMRNPSGEKLTALKERIQHEKNLSGRDWLLRQVESLEQKF